MKTTDHKLHRLSAIILSAVFVLISCTKVTYPEPSENPVHLTAEAQTKQITVENMFGMYREDSTDKLFYEEGFLIIENDWARFAKKGNESSMTKVIQISVKENTTTQSRTHSVSLGSGTKNTVLTVIQAGKP